MEILHPNEIAELSDEDLLNLHGRLHAYFTEWKLDNSKYNLEEIVNQHLFVLQELVNRDIRHHSTDQLDEESEQFVSIAHSFSGDENEAEEAISFSAAFEKALSSPSEWSAEEFIEDKPASIPGIYLTPPHGRLIAEKQKTLIIKSIKFTRYTGTPVVVVSGKLAYAEIVLQPPYQIDLVEFADLSDRHRISEAERKKWWGSKKKLYAYEFSLQKIYSPPKKVDVPPGTQTFLRQVELEKRMSPVLATALEELEDIIVIPDFVSISGKTVLEEPSNDIDFIWRGKFDEDSIVLQLREMLMKFTRSFPAELHEEFHHVDSPMGPAWHYRPVADLVLRFKNSPTIELENDSYAYHKPKKANKDEDSIGNNSNDADSNVDKNAKDEIVCWVACFPQDKDTLLKLQEQLGLDPNDEANANGLHLTLAVFNSFADIEEIRQAVTATGEEEFIFKPTDFDCFGKEADTFVLRGEVPTAISKLAEEIRQHDSAIVNFPFSPHITLGKTADISEQTFKADLPEGITMSSPTFMISTKELKKQDESGMGAAISFRVIGRMRKSRRFETVEKEPPEKNITGDKAIKLYKELSTGSDVWLLRCAFKDGSEWIAMDSPHVLIDTDLALEWNAEIIQPQWEGLQDPKLWEMDEGFQHRKIGEYKYWATFSKQFKNGPPALGSIITVNPARLLRFIGIDSQYHYTWLWPSIITPTEAEVDDIKDIAARGLVEEKEAVLKRNDEEEIGKYRHSLEHCMMCKKLPELEVLWAEGRAHAWFCKKHFQYWATNSNSGHEGGWDDIDAVKQVQNGIAAKKFSENTNPNIREELKTGIHEYLDLDKSANFKIKLLQPFTPIKSKAGYHKYEFQVGEEDLLWDTWAAGFMDDNIGKSNGRVAIIDIDDTCFSAQDRLERCSKNGEIDWNCAFSNEEVLQDPPIPGALEGVKRIGKLGIGLIYLTGRSEACRDGTLQSLGKHGFPPGNAVIMRADGDLRADNIIKQEVLAYLKQAFDIVGAADDDYSGKLGPMYNKVGIKHFKNIKALAMYVEEL